MIKIALAPASRACSARLDVAGRRRAALDFTDHGEAAVAAAKRRGKGRRPRAARVELRELRLGDVADERRDFLPLPSHDLGEFVCHRHHEGTKSPGVKTLFFVRFAAASLCCGHERDG